MFVPIRTMSRFPSLKRFSALAAALAAVFGAEVCLAQQTRLWTQSRLEEFEKGTPQGVSIASDGHLRQGPALKEILTSPSTFVWSVAVGKDGTAYVGTGSPATVLRVGKDGKPFTLFETSDLSVQVVRLAPDGKLLAATVPSGKVYSLDPNATTRQDESKAEVIFDAAKQEDANGAARTPGDKAGANANDTKPEDGRAETKTHYIWDMTFDARGRLYVATGGPGIIYRITAGSPPEVFFKSDEEHLRSLAWDANGNLIAGSDGSGLVYRIDRDGKGYVLYQSPHREITSVAVGANGTIYAAGVGEKGHNPLPPLPVQGVGSVTITVVQPGSLQAANTSASLPEGSEIYALADGQAPRKLWAGKDEIVYGLDARPDGLLAFTGNRGRIFKVGDDGTYSDIAHLEAQQGLCWSESPGGDILVGSGNTGKLFRLGAAETHEYASDVLDAGAMARFGRVEVEPGSTGYDLLTRTGNVEQPVRGWSDWQPLADGVVASPAGRFLQWKAVLRAGGSMGGVGVNYLPVNSAPVVDEMVVVPGARLNTQSQPASQAQTISITLPSSSQGATVTFDASSSALTALKDRTAITVRWAAHDDDGDDLIYALYLRGDGESVWRLLKDQLTDRAYTFDASLIPDGGYEIKVVASDAPSHTPGDSLTGEKVSERFEVDTTPPVIGAVHAVDEHAACKQAPCAQKFRVSFDAEDAISPIAHAEYSLDAGPWQFVNPVGQLSDSRREHYDFEVTAPSDGKLAEGKLAEHLITVRAYDRHDNVGVAKAVIPPAK
jgi:hypothetical protein